MARCRKAGGRGRGAGAQGPPSMRVPFQTNDPVTNICHAADKQLFTLVEWAKRIPHFSDLTLEDQVILLRAGKGCRGSFLLGTVTWAALLKLPLGVKQVTRRSCEPAELCTMLMAG